MPLMAGKQGLIMGVANERSIAWGIAKALHAHGADLAFTYQGEALGKRVRPLALGLDSDVVLEADVASAESERPYPLPQRLALISEGEVGAMMVQCLRDSPGDGPLVGDTHDEALLTRH